MQLKEIIAPRTSKHQIRLESPRVRRVKVTKSTGASWPSGHSRWSIYLITYTCIAYNVYPVPFGPGILGLDSCHFAQVHGNH